MPTDRERFFNIILCEDIRHEVGNKRTLVGVFGGDVIVGDFPANLRLAVYMQFMVDPESPTALINLDLLSENEPIGKLGIRTKPGIPIVALEVPQFMMTVVKETRFRVAATIEGRETIEILNKAIKKAPVVA